MHKYAGGSGFKSLRTFNYAILGKQSWKLLTSLVNLITKLLKAKYFPKSNFLSSSIGHNPSYVWQNIWSAKFIFFFDGQACIQINESKSVQTAAAAGSGTYPTQEREP
jgi:predicted lipoprotein